MRRSFGRSKAESTPCVVQRHAGHVEELAPRSSSRGQGDRTPGDAQLLCDEPHELGVGATLDRRSGETDPQTPVDDAGQSASLRSRCDPDREAEAAVAGLRQRSFVTS